MFNGIDTCIIKTFGLFYFNSKPPTKSEYRAISSSPDINALLSKLFEEKVMLNILPKACHKEYHEFKNIITTNH